MTFSTRSTLLPDNSFAPYTVIRQNQYCRMPWKNNLGETLEICRSADDKGLRFRISQAPIVDNSTFSDFSGLDRSLILLKGAGINLQHQKKNQNISRHSLKLELDMAHFDGEAITQTDLINGSIEALNIMVRKQDTKADIKVCIAPFCLNYDLTEISLFTGFYTHSICSLELIMQYIQKGNQKSIFWSIDLPENSLFIVNSDATLLCKTGHGIFIKVKEF